MQDIMYNGIDYSWKVPGDEEGGEANDTAREIGTGTENTDDLETEDEDSSPGGNAEEGPHHTHILKYPESSAPEDCLYVVKWGGEPGAGKVDFEIRSKRKTGMIGFCKTKETVSFVRRNTLSTTFTN